MVHKIYSIVGKHYLIFLPDPDAVSCYDGEVRLGYSDMEGSGFLEVCYQNNWISVCLNGNENSTNTSQLAELACQSIVGYGNMSFTSLVLVSFFP